MSQRRNILVLSAVVVGLSAAAQVPPPLPPVKTPAARATATTQGSGAAALLSMKAAAIPVPVLLQVSWAPAAIVRTQMVYPALVITGSVAAWSTNWLTNFYEVQECSDGIWSTRVVTNRSPVTFTRSNGRVQILRVRSYWQ